MRMRLSRSGASPALSRLMARKNPAAPEGEVMLSTSAPPSPTRNQCVVPPGMCTSAPVPTVDSWSPEPNVTSEHVEGLVPRVVMRRRPAALSAHLQEDLVAARLGARSEDGEVLADEVERPRSLVGCHHDRSVAHPSPQVW